MSNECDHGVTFARYCESCVGDGSLVYTLTGFVLGSATTFAVWVLVLLLSGCAGLPSGGSAHLGSLVTREYEQAVSLEVDCVYPVPLAGSPAAAVVKLLGSLPDGGYGSGVAVGPDLVATARHVVDCDFELPFNAGVLDGNPMLIKAKRLDGSSFELVVQEQGLDSSDDFALLATTAGAVPFKHWAVPRRTNPHIGEEVCVMAAYPWFLRRCGEVGQVKTGDKWMGAGYVVYDAHSDHGNSGAGVYDRDGYLVAIHVANVGRSSGGGYMVGRWRGRMPEGHAPLDMR